jgi:GDP-mannose 6-dehydrogenase
MVKYTCNVWHATKITFANEIGNISKELGVDGREVMDVICQDHKLNISSYYMKPGYAFGGSCLPKDVRALNFRATQVDAEHPLIASLMHSNEVHVKRAFDLVSSFGTRRVGMLGLSFKPQTDDLRESPLVELAEMLIGKGYELAIFDENIEYARVHGANREYITRRIPHISSLLNPDLDQVIEGADVLVVGQRDHNFEKVLNGARGERKVVDLVGLMPHTSTAEMQGICW